MQEFGQSNLMKEAVLFQDAFIVFVALRVLERSGKSCRRRKYWQQFDVSGLADRKVSPRGDPFTWWPSAETLVDVLCWRARPVLSR